MDVEFLSRVQFGLTAGFHYIYPPMSIGLALILVIMEGMYLKTRDPLYERMTKFWVKVFALTFSLGVATGLVQIFAFGTNWAAYSRYVGDVFGSALAAEGIFAFFLESGFLALLLFGWDKVGPKMHFFSTIMVAAGSHFSAIWIIAANSWMQTPAGYKIVGEGATAHAVVTDFWVMILNHSTIDRLVLSILGCWLTGSFLVISISAFYLLKKRHRVFAERSMHVALTVAAIVIVLQLFSADSTARGVAKNQPIKLAAMEATYKTTPGTPLYLGGIVDKETQTVKGIAIPNLLSFLVYHDFKTPVPGLDQYPKELWPNVAVVFQTYHAMIAMWSVMFVLAGLAFYQWRRKRLADCKWLLRGLIFAVACPHIANFCGWCTAEIGRQPWVVYGLLKTSDGLSKNIQASQVMGSLIMFVVMYTLLFVLFIYLLDRKIKEGPHDVDMETHKDFLHTTPHEVL